MVEKAASVANNTASKSSGFALYSTHLTNIWQVEVGNGGSSYAIEGL